jgi:hypothetical protein
MRRPLPLLVRLAAITAIGIVSSFAHAETFLDKRPSDTLTFEQAVNNSKAGKTVYKCRKARYTATGRIGKIPGSKETYHSKIPKGLENAEDRLLKHQETFGCKAVAFDSDSKTLKTAVAADE